MTRVVVLVVLMAFAAVPAPAATHERAQTFRGVTTLASRGPATIRLTLAKNVTLADHGQSFVAMRTSGRYVGVVLRERRAGGSRFVRGHVFGRGCWPSTLGCAPAVFMGGEDIGVLRAGTYDVTILAEQRAEAIVTLLLPGLSGTTSVRAGSPVPVSFRMTDSVAAGPVTVDEGAFEHSSAGPLLAVGGMLVNDSYPGAPDGAQMLAGRATYCIERATVSPLETLPAADQAGSVYRTPSCERFLAPGAGSLDAFPAIRSAGSGPAPAAPAAFFLDERGPWRFAYRQVITSTPGIKVGAFALYARLPS